MKKSITIGIICVFIIVCVIPSTGTIVERLTIKQISYNGNTFYVGGDGLGNYTTIQGAINDANTGDTVFVYNGTYYENIIVDKQITLKGENCQGTIIDGGYKTNTIKIIVSNVNISFLQIIKGSLTCGGGGILLYNANETISNININNCVINENNKAIDLVSNCSDIQIRNCDIYNNRRASIQNLYSLNNILIDNCKIYNNGDNPHNGGVSISGYTNEILSSNIIISNCTIFKNYIKGISLTGVENVIIENNEIFDSICSGSPHPHSIGIYLNVIINVMVVNNKIYNNSCFGIFIPKYKSDEIYSNVVIQYNNISNNGGVGFYNSGIFLQRVTGSTIIEKNLISSNSLGIDIFYSTGSKIFDNTFVDNVKHASFKYNSKFHFNNWNGNYWGRPRLLPKIIFGVIDRDFLIPWFNIDWHPAKEPYNIGV
jgi:parallel beta-helix repeat protein